MLSIFNKSTNLISVQGVPHKIALCFLTQAGLTVDILSWWTREIGKVARKGSLTPIWREAMDGFGRNRTSFLLIGKGEKNFS